MPLLHACGHRMLPSNANFLSGPDVTSQGHIAGSWSRLLLASWDLCTCTFRHVNHPVRPFTVHASRPLRTRQQASGCHRRQTQAQRLRMPVAPPMQVQWLPMVTGVPALCGLRWPAPARGTVACRWSEKAREFVVRERLLQVPASVSLTIKHVYGEKMMRVSSILPFPCCMLHENTATARG